MNVIYVNVSDVVNILLRSANHLLLVLISYSSAVFLSYLFCNP